MPDYKRKPLRAFEFRQRVERFRELYPGSRIESTHRTQRHNLDVGGLPNSKHVLSPLEPIAVDLSWPHEETIEERGSIALGMEHDAKVLGLWATFHDGHMHLQGLQPGPVPVDWKP